MANAQRKPRRDAYGEKLPELSDATRESLKDKESNLIQRQLIRDVLERLYNEHLRRGQYLSISINFQVVNGVIQADVFESIERRWRNPDA